MKKFVGEILDYYSFIQWTDDEQTFALIINGELRFFEVRNPDIFVKKITVENLTSFSWNSTSKIVALHASGKTVCKVQFIQYIYSFETHVIFLIFPKIVLKNQPSFIRLYVYPNVIDTIANKSFFNADKVEMKWNKLGKIE